MNASLGDLILCLSVWLVPVAALGLFGLMGGRRAEDVEPGAHPFRLPSRR